MSNSAYIYIADFLLYLCILLKKIIKIPHTYIVFDVNQEMNQFWNEIADCFAMLGLILT